jgi:hypothetical protein
MPLTWKRGTNPYRTNFFGTLGVGPGAQPAVINATRKNLVAKIASGTAHLAGGRPVSETEINEAAARLMDDASRAAERLLVHAVPTGGSKRLHQVCAALIAATTPPVAYPPLRLTNLPGLAPLIPAPGPEDIAWPEWEDFGFESDEENDIQFDL